MKKTSVRQKVIASFLVVLAVVLAITGLTYARLQQLRRESTSVAARSLPAVFHSDRILQTGMLLQARVGQQLLESDRRERQRLASEIGETQRQLQALMDGYRSTILQAPGEAPFAALERAQQDYGARIAPLLSLDAGSRGEGGAVDPEYHAAGHRIEQAARQLVDFNQQRALAAQQRIATAVDEVHSALLTASALATLFLVTSCAFVLRRARDLAGLIGQVQQSGITVDSSVNEIAATAKEQQATAAEIAASTSEIGATSREITATSRELLRTMGEVAGGAERSAVLAGSSQAGLERMGGTMHQVIHAAGAINAKLAVLNEKAGNISHMVTTITRVADQTNLLSLNAAIEAEKAGDYGRGFAVVAVEIRRLADQTAVATYDIEQMVKEIQSAVSAGVMGMDKFSEEVRRGISEMQEAGAQLSQLIQQVQGLAPRFDEVTEGMRAQTTGAEQITQALNQLGDASQQTVESLRQSSAAIEDLSQVAGSLRSGIARFRLGEGAA